MTLSAEIQKNPKINKLTWNLKFKASRIAKVVLKKNKVEGFIAFGF